MSTKLNPEESYSDWSMPLIMEGYYPVSLQLGGKTCLVVGGGEVAVRKAASLLEYGAVVEVVSATLKPGMEKMVETGQVSCLRRGYESGDVCGKLLVVSATDDQGLNQKVAMDCRRAGVLVNVVDDPVFCDFIVPSVLRRGALTISVSTGGASPLLARRIREQLEDLFGLEYGEYLKLLGKIRTDVLQMCPDAEKRRRIFSALLESDLLDLLRAGDHDQVKERIQQCIYWT